jgi:palmitoyltransferase ZDHHC3/7/25
MMRSDDIENGHTYPSESIGTRQRRAPGGNYSSIPTQQQQQQHGGGYGPNSYSDDIDSLKKKSTSYSTPTFNTLSQTSVAVPGGLSFFTSTAHLTEGLNQPYYRDNFNDQPHTCGFGTGEENGIWWNMSDQAGTIMAFLVWLLLGYSAWTFTALAKSGGVPPFLCMIYVIICMLALASHAKTTFTDPGCVPQAAVPNERMRREMGTPDQPLSMCSQCQTFKPPFSHHCRICNRCISRMDHHCPWMNNCIGVANLKHFILFLVYTWACSVFALLLLGWNYFMCGDEDCEFNGLLTQLVRAVTVLSIGALLFTSSMIMNVTFGLMTGIGTIDRLKKKANDTIGEAIEEPMPIRDVFGIGAYWTWLLPIDPLFDDYDRVMGFSTPQRLLREEMRGDPTKNFSPSGVSKDMLSI